MTFDWDFEGREEYIDRVVPAAVEGHDVFYYFSCNCASGAPSAGYTGRLTDWVAKRFDNRYRVESIAVGQGMIAIRFEAASSE